MSKRYWVISGLGLSTTVASVNAWMATAQAAAATDAVASQTLLPDAAAGYIGLLNYGVLGILTLGFIRGWVVTPRERDRLAQDNTELKEEAKGKDEEIARLNTVMQEQLQAMVATTDKQIDLWSRRRVEESSRD